MNTPCSVPLLESALAGNLPQEEEASLHRHLEECAVCSAALEQMAGGPAWCQKAASLLTDDELDAAVPTRDQWSDVDFTVEHLEPTDEPDMLGRLGGYDVLEIIGRGGMGVVLKGFDRQLKRCVAIKVLAPHLAQNSLARKRFAREAQAAAAVVHPHVLAIHQVQPGGRLPFLVMPLVAGESLAERLKAQGTLEFKEILRIGMQAAAGLAAAHEQGLVHRDVKPANILLEKGVERAVLTDFGLACAADDVTLTRWGIIAGTPPYMSPEQARGEPLDGRSDLFSLGCVLYEMATGVSPFLADSVVATIRRLVDDPPQAMASLNPELPPWFVALVERLLEKEPARRFSSAKEVSELLEGCLAHVQQPASVPLPAGLPKLASRGRSKFNLGKKGILTMIGTFGIGLLGALLVTGNPPDIAGQWTGENWGVVELKRISDTEYTGTYSETSGKTPGEIHLKWSRIERRFNGTWSERQAMAFTPDGKALLAGAGRVAHGKLSVRLDGDEIRGAQTTDPKSTINPATPRLADLTWRREALSKSPDRTRTPESQNDPTSPAQAARPSEIPLWNAFGVTPAPVSTLTAKVLESIGLHLRPITRDDFREKNVFAKYPGGLKVTFVRTHGPAEKAGIYEVDIVVGLQRQPTANLKDLDQAVQDAADQIRRGDAQMFRFEVLRSGATVEVHVPFSVRDLDPRSPAGPSDNARDPNKPVDWVVLDPSTLDPRVELVGRSLLVPLTGDVQGPLWGTDVYTDDSRLAKAAVHAGVLKPGETGTVKVTIMPGQSSYQGSTRHGVTSSDYGSYGGSFRIERAKADDRRAAGGEAPDRTLFDAFNPELIPPFDLTRTYAALEWLNKSMASEGMLSGSRRAAAESLLQRLTALLGEYEHFAEAYRPGTPKLIQLESKITVVVAEILAMRARRKPAGVAPPAESGSTAEFPGRLNITQREVTTDLSVAPPEARKVKPDKEAIQGLWKVVASEVDGWREPNGQFQAVKIVGNKIFFRGKDRVIDEGLFTLDETQKPKHINSVESKEKGAVSLVGIYLLNGDHLVLCIVSGSEKRSRPTKFKTEPGDGLLLMVLEREEPLAPPEGGEKDQAGIAPDKHALAIAEAELEKARAAVEFARANAGRMAELAKQQAIDAGVVDEANARVRMAEADEKAAQARLDSLLDESNRPGKNAARPSNSPRRKANDQSQQGAAQQEDPNAAATGAAPDKGTPFEDFTGRIVDREVDDVSDAFAALAPLSPAKRPRKGIMFRFDMDERSYLRYQRLLAANKVKCPGEWLAVRLSDEANFDRVGALVEFENKFNPATGAIGVYGVLPNDDDLLKPGMFVRVRVEFSSLATRREKADAKDELQGSKPDKEAIQGRWKVVGWEADGWREANGYFQVARIIGDKIFFREGKDVGGDVQEFRFKLNESQKPKQIDVVGTDGGNKGVIVPAGIYRLDGDRLVLCILTGPNGTSRPTKFETERGDGLWLMVLEREEPLAPPEGGEKDPNNADPSQGESKVEPAIQGSKERLATLTQLAKATEQEFLAGRTSFDRVQQATRAVLDAELELCETDKDRITVLEKIVTLAKQNEQTTEQRYKTGRAPRSDVLTATARRMEAEIALERAKSKVPARPK